MKLKIDPKDIRKSRRVLSRPSAVKTQIHRNKKKDVGTRKDKNTSCDK